MVAPKKGPKDFDGNLKKTGAALGQLLARSQAKLEKTRLQAIKSTGRLVDRMTRKAEQTVEATAEKIHTATASTEEQSRKTATARFKPVKNNAINESVRILAEDILTYLIDNGKTTTAELQMVMEKRRRNPGMIFAAIGWLAGENKVHITRDGNNISMK
jgi:ATP:corrinoid adenosyltransferase